MFVIWIGMWKERNKQKGLVHFKKNYVLKIVRPLSFRRKFFYILHGLFEALLGLVRTSKGQMASSDPFEKFVLHLGRVVVVEREVGVTESEEVVLPFPGNR